jgi:hypothetical protein
MTTAATTVTLAVTPRSYRGNVRLEFSLDGAGPWAEEYFVDHTLGLHFPGRVVYVPEAEVQRLKDELQGKRKPVVATVTLAPRPRCGAWAKSDCPQAPGYRADYFDALTGQYIGPG